MGIFSINDQKKLHDKFESIKQGKFTATDTATVLNNMDDILSKSADGPLAKCFDDIKTMCNMVSAWANKEYKGIPCKTIGMIILILILQKAVQYFTQIRVFYI